MTRLGFFRIDLDALAQGFLKLPTGSRIISVRKAEFLLDFTIDSPLFEENDLPDNIPEYILTYRDENGKTLSWVSFKHANFFN